MDPERPDPTPDEPTLGTPEEPTHEPSAPASGELRPAPRAGVRRIGSTLRIPGYHIEGVIGRGSTGTVYRARQETVDREVALKVLHEDLSSRPRMVRRLQREARTTARLAHPHIVSAIDMGRTGERWWFAMELVDGPSLALRLRQDGRIGEREALRLFIPLCEALVHIWENGVVHRDIKPANILIDRVSGARLADLGLAFADDDPHLTGSEGTLGTPHYISPEQARDPSSVDIRTDIWSFGATLFHAVCGEPPLRGANVAEVLSGVLYGRVPDPEDLEPDLSKGLSLVLRKCLSRDFERRYQTPRELLLDLERVRERRRPKVRVASLEPTAGERFDLGRLLLSVGLLVVLGVAVGLLWKRPWADVGGRVEYPPLTQLAAELGSAGAPPGSWLVRLEGLKAELPPADLGRWRELHAEGRIALEAALAATLAEAEQAFEAALARKDYPQAKAAIAGDLELELLESTGLAPTLAGPEVQVAVVALEHRLERELDSAEAESRQRLERAIEDELLAEVESLLAGGRWSDARALLGVAPEALPAALGLSMPALTPTRAGRLVELAGDRLLGARMDLDRRWSALDEELVRWIELEQGDLEDELSRTLMPVGASDRIVEAFDLELFRRGLTPEQLPVEPAGLARDRLKAAVRDLVDIEARLAASREPSGTATADRLVGWLDQTVSAEDWRLRRYEQVDDFWAARLDELEDGLAGSAEEGTRQRVLAKRLEATLLMGLRDRAVAALQAFDGREVELHMSSDVRAQGRLEQVGVGASEGLIFEVAADRSYELFVSAPRAGLPPGARLLHLRDVELFAGFDVEGVITGRSKVLEADRLALALFRVREGDDARALALLGTRTFGAELEGLASELRRGLERRASLQGAREELRLRDARGLLATLYLDEADGAQRLRRDPGRALATITRLRSEFADLDVVVDVAERLDQLQAELESPGGKPTLEDFEQAFGAGVPRFLGSDQVELQYFFEGTEVPGFLLEDWTPDGLNWVSPGDIVDDQDLITRPTPRLVLRRPLDVTRGDLVAELDFTEPFGAGTERLVVVSVAGFHLAVRTAEGAGRSEVAASTTGLDQLMADLRSSPETVSGRLLSAGGSYRLRVEVNQQNGRILALLAERDPRRGEFEYREILQDKLVSPRGRAGSAGVSLRARESIQLSSLWLRGQR